MARKFTETENEIICEIDYGSPNTAIIRTTKPQYEILHEKYGPEATLTMCMNMFEIPLTTFYGESPLNDRERQKITEVLKKFDGQCDTGTP